MLLNTTWILGFSFLFVVWNLLLLFTVFFTSYILFSPFHVSLYSSFNFWCCIHAVTQNTFKPIATDLFNLVGTFLLLSAQTFGHETSFFNLQSESHRAPLKPITIAPGRVWKLFSSRVHQILLTQERGKKCKMNLRLKSSRSFPTRRVYWTNCTADSDSQCISTLFRLVEEKQT